MKEHSDADCWCNTCGRAFHHLGIAGHRAAHRNRREDCEIEYNDGRVVTHEFSKSARCVAEDN